MKINDLSLVRLHNEEHFQFNTSFKDLVVKSTPAALKIETLFTAYLSCYAKEMEALNLVKKSAISDDLSEADAARDGIFRGMSDAIKSALNHFNADMREAANRLQILLDRYGNVSVKTFEAETGAINSLIADLNTSYTADVTKLQLAPWVSELAQRNKAFDDLKNSRYSAEATKTMLRMKDERQKVDAAYRALVERLNALIIVEGEAAYADFVNELNKRIEGFNNTIAIRKGKLKQAADKSTPVQ